MSEFRTRRRASLDRFGHRPRAPGRRSARRFRPRISSATALPLSAPRRMSRLVDAQGEISKVAVHGGGILCSVSDGKRIVMGGDDGKLVALDVKGDVIDARDRSKAALDRQCRAASGRRLCLVGRQDRLRAQRQGRGKIVRRAVDRRRARLCAEGPAARDRALQRRDAVVSEHGGERRNFWNGRARISASPSAPTTNFWSPPCTSRRCMAGGSPTTGTCA